MTELTVVAEGSESAAVEAPAAISGPQSPLAALRGKRSSLDARLYLDLSVPRWDEVLEGRKLWVRYHPGSPAVLTDAMTKREQAHLKAVRDGGHGDKDWSARANAELLVSACVAIYDLAADEEPTKGELPPGDYPKFGAPELSAAVGAPANAVETVLKVYATHADILLAVNQLLNWSGQASGEAQTGFLGR